LFPEVHPLKATVLLSETADNSPQLNVVPKLMVQTIDFHQTTPNILLQIDVEGAFQRSHEEYRRITGGNVMFR
jgi:hypothetical protein